MPTVHAYAATETGGQSEPFEYDLPDTLQHDEVEIDIRYCGQGSGPIPLDYTLAGRN